MEFRILGPLRVIGDDGPIAVSGRRQRTVLAVLLANARQLVPLEYLVDAVWDDYPPATAKRQMQNCLALLRRLLAGGTAGKPLIVTDGPGYRIMPERNALDAEMFQECVARAATLAGQGRDAQAASELRSALGLWHGPALFGLTGRVVEASAASLNEQRLAATEQYLDLELRLGHHDGLVVEIGDLVAANPLREPLVGYLLLALHRTGRQADAVQAYHRYRGLLADELGVDPAPELQQLYTAILLNDPSAGPPSSTEPRLPRREAEDAPPTDAVSPPAQLPADVNGFTGRAEYLKMLDGLLPNGADATAVVIASIVGMAGVGKTALAVHWAHQVRDRFPDGQFYANLRGYSPDAPTLPVEVLAQFLSALCGPAEQIPADVETAAALYRSKLAGRRVLILLDNAADADQVRPLLPGSPGCLVLVTSRARLSGLAVHEGAHRLTLDVLTADDALVLLAHIVGSDRVAAEPVPATDLVRACAYLPLALRIAAVNLANNPGLSIAAHASALRGGSRLSALDIDDDERTGIRRAFDLSYRTLDADARRMFRLLGLVPGHDVTAEAAAALTGTSPSHAGRQLNRLVAEHLANQHAPGRYSYHDLVREYAAEQVGIEHDVSERRAATQRLSDWYLHRADGAARLLYPQRLRLPVPSLPQQVPFTDHADHADALAWLDAERVNLVAAIQHAATEGPLPTAWLLADTLRGYFELRMHTVDWARSARAGLAAAAMDADVRAQAAMLLSIGELEHQQSHYDEAIESLRRALAFSDEAGWLEGQAAALGFLGVACRDSGQIRASAAHHERALTLYRQIGSRYGEAVVLDCLGRTYFQTGRLAAATRCYVRALKLYREVGSQRGEALALHDLGEVSHFQARDDEALTYLTEALRVAQDIGDCGNHPYILATLALVHLDIRSPAGAADLAGLAVRAAEALDDPRAVAVALNARAAIDHRLGRHADAVRGHRRALELTGTTGDRYPEVDALIGLAAAAEALGDADEARGQSERAYHLASETGLEILKTRARTILDRLG